MIPGGRLGCAGLIVISSLFLPQPEARAARMMVTLTYAADSGCPDATELKAVVVGRLGYDPFVEDSKDHVLVRLERRAGGVGMDGRIEWRDAAGRWTGEQLFPSVSTECASLARAVGFALAVQIQFLATASSSGGGGAADAVSPGGLGGPPDVPVPLAPPERPPATGREAARPEGERTADAEPTVAPPVEGAVRSEPSPARSEPTFAIGAGPSVGLGFSSSPVGLGRLFGAVLWPRVSIELAAVASLPATVRRRDGAGFEQQHLFGSAALCGGASRWRGCLLANAGEIRMSGKDIERPTSATVALFQMGLRAAVIQPLGRRAFVDAHADGLINVTRWTGRLDQIPVWTAPRFGAAVGLDVGVLLN